MRSLSVAVVLEWAGAGAMLPLLPLYVRSRGGSDAVVGAVMAAYFAAAVIFQYGAGRLSDRLGRMPVLVGGLVVYACGSLLFLLPGPVVLDVVFRALQGAGSGASMVAALALVSHTVPLSYRGRVSGRIYGAQLGGLAVGPVLGSVAGVGAMRWLFLAAAVACLGAIAPVLATASAEAGLRAGRNRAPGDVVVARVSVSAIASLEDQEIAVTQVAPRLLGARPLSGAIVAAAVIGLAEGVYDACWSLLMTRHGAAPWEIGVTWTLFALPFAALSRPAGWLADHLDRRWLAIASLLSSVAFLTTYPFLPGFVWLMVLGAFESVGFALVLPACQSLLGQGTSPEQHGHAQGLFAASQTGSAALAAGTAGALFGIHAWLPFVGAAACCTVLTAVVALIWRGVSGKVRASSDAVAG